MSHRKPFYLSCKYSLYALLLVVFYAVQTTPGAFAIYGIRPVWVVPLAVAIAMCEGVIPAALFGGAAGLFCDLGSQALFGFNGLMLLALCSAVSLLSSYLVKAGPKSALLLGAGVAAFRAVFEFFFFYAIWNYPGVNLIFVRATLPVLVYTILLTPPFFLLIRKIKVWLDGKWQEA